MTTTETVVRLIADCAIIYQARTWCSSEEARMAALAWLEDDHPAMSALRSLAAVQVFSRHQTATETGLTGRAQGSTLLT